MAKPDSCCSGGKAKSSPETAAGSAKHLDPVCGMTVDPATAKASFEHAGQQFYFCCTGCKTKFSADPDKYLQPKAKSCCGGGGHGAHATETPAPAPALEAAAETPKKGGCCGGKGKHGGGMSLPVLTVETHVDPVCKMTVEPASAAATFDWQGTKYYFCCAGCKTKFSTNPAAYLSPAPVVSPKEPVAAASGYTCPMHPAVLSEKPGDCPDCGMPLEPLGASADDGSAEVAQLSNRLRWTALLSVPVFLLSMSHMFGMGPMADTGGGAHLLSCWLQMLLATPVVFWAARPIFEKGIASVRNKSANMFTLLSLGIAIPYIYSVISLVAVTLSGNGIPADHMVYFESSAVITALAWLGQWLEAKARQQSSSALRDLVNLAPAEATVLLADGQEARVSVKDIALHAKVRVAPGERIAVDGIVIDGRSAVDESMLTGEAIPASKSAGSTVSAGTVNGTGSLLIDVERVGAQTMLAQIVELVGKAQRSRVPVQNLADQVASVFVPVVLLIAVVTAAGWLWTGAGLIAALSAATAVLVIACPCALGLATPMSIVVAAGRAAQAGVLFKEARSLQLLGGVNVVVVDKTGTLTEGKPQVVAVAAAAGFSEGELLAAAAAVESSSEHPLARAILDATQARGLAVVKGVDFQSVSGMGAAAVVDGRNVSVGNVAYLRSLGIVLPADDSSANVNTSVFVAVDGQFAGRIDCADKLRANARESVRALQQAGLIVMLASGDRVEVVQSVATSCGITDFQAQLLPADKAALITALQSQGAKVAMAGDGINDAPALAQAEVGIAVASGTDIAMHTADIVLMNSDIAGINRAITLSRAMMVNIKQNLALAFAYNLVAIPLAAGLLVPLVGILINPMVAAAFMSISSVAVVVNALRLRRLAL